MFELAVIFLLLLANGFFALAELSIVSSKRPKLAQLAERRVAGARAALLLGDRQDDFLSAVQVGITLVGIISGAYGGAAFADALGEVIGRVDLLKEHSHSIAYTIIVAMLTYASVVIGELVPKHLALGSPERFACIVAVPMVYVVTVAKPVVWLLSASSGVLLRLMGKTPNETPAATKEEASFAISEAVKSGAMDEQEQDIATRALRIGDRPAASIMTPRRDVTCLRLDESLESTRKKILEAPHSQIPVCGKSPDDVRGVLSVKQLLAHMATAGLPGDDLKRRQLIASLMTTPVFVPATASTAVVIEAMRREKTHFAIVSDEYGGMGGIVTNHDLLEALVGYVPGHEEDEEAMVMRPDGSVLAAGWVNMGELMKTLTVSCPPELESMTLAGMLMSAGSGLPAVGQQLSMAGLRLEIVDKDDARIDRVLVTKELPVESVEHGPA